MAYCKVLVNEIRRLSVTVVYKAQNDIVKERRSACAPSTVHNISTCWRAGSIHCQVVKFCRATTFHAILFIPLASFLSTVFRFISFGLARLASTWREVLNFYTVYNMYRCLKNILFLLEVLFIRSSFLLTTNKTCYFLLKLV